METVLTNSLTFPRVHVMSASCYS